MCLRFIAAFLAFVTFGCASSPTEHVNVSAEDRGVVRNNKSQPEWATNLFKASEDGKYFVVKMTEKVYRLDVGIEQARVEAMGSAAQMIGTDIGKQVTSALTGDNTDPEGVSQAIDSAVHALSTVSMTGIETADTYWEEIKGEQNKKNYYNVYLLLSIPDNEVERAKKIFLRSLVDNEKLTSLKDKVESAVNSYRGNRN